MKKKTSTGARTKQALSAAQRDDLLKTLKARFEKNMQRHRDLDWDQIEARLEANAAKLCSLHLMESTGGEPDVIGQDAKTGEYLFVDCSEQTPTGRTSLCYDDAALESRKEHKPKDSVIGMAAAMGVELLTEEEYHALQKLGEFDTKRSSWLKTPPDIRKLGGAIWGGRSYGRVFIGSNGAESYFSSRAFRASLRV